MPRYFIYALLKQFQEIKCQSNAFSMRYQNTQDLYDTYISFCKKKIYTITNHAFCSFSDNLLNRRFARVANPDQPMNGGQHCPFPSTIRPYFIVQLLLLARSMPSPQYSVPNDVEVLATANTKTKQPRVKSANWTEEETHEVLEA